MKQPLLEQIPKHLALVLCLGIAALTGGCGSDGPPPEPKPEVGVYLQYNVHVQDLGRGARHSYRASYLNNIDPGKGHLILPVNTEVLFLRWRGGFAFRMVGERDNILYTFDRRRVGLSAREYQKIIAGPKPRNLDGFSPIDMKGIQEGKAYLGMTKEGVMVALGYPSPHKTKAPDADTFVYWKDGRQTLTVEFNADGKVANIK